MVDPTRRVNYHYISLIFEVIYNPTATSNDYRQSTHYTGCTWHIPIKRGKKSPCIDVQSHIFRPSVSPVIKLREFTYQLFLDHQVNVPLPIHVRFCWEHFVSSNHMPPFRFRCVLVFPNSNRYLRCKISGFCLLSFSQNKRISFAQFLYFLRKVCLL